MKQFCRFALHIVTLFVMVSAVESQAEFPAQSRLSSTPPAKSSAPRSSAAKRQQAIAALGRAREAFGGLRRLQAIRDVTRVVEMVHHPTDARARETFQIVFPNAIRLTTDSVLGEVTAFSDGHTAWASSVLGIDDSLPEWQIRAARQDLFRQFESLLQSDRDPDNAVEFVERGEAAAKPADVLQISSAAAGTVRLWIDAASGEVLEVEYPRVVARGNGSVVTDFFSDYRWVDQTLRVPFHIRTLSDGQPYMDTQVLRIEYNRGLRAEDLSRKPSPELP